MAINCASCKQSKKQENFSVKSLASSTPTCSTCDVNSLMKRIELARQGLNKIKQEQKAVIEVSSKVENATSTKPKTTTQSFLKNILSSRTSG